LTNNIPKRQLHNDEIDLKQVFKTLKKYKVSIFLITLVFLIGSTIFAYYKPNIFSSKTTIQITKESRGGNPEDMLLKALGEDGSNIEDEIVIVKSRLVVQKALESLPLDINYYKYNKLNKKSEFYKDSPFIVSNTSLDENIYKKTFEIIPIDEHNFKLIIKPISMYSISGLLKKIGVIPYQESDKIVYNGSHKFNEEIKTPYFSIIIHKLNNMDAKKYSFRFIQKDDLYDNYIQNLSVNTVSKMASILELSYQDNSPLRAKEILNSISKTYVDLNVKEKSIVAELTLGFIDKQLEKINKNLTKSAMKLEEYRLKNNIVNLEIQAQSKNTKLEGYKTQLFEVITEMKILSNLSSYINKDKDILGLTVSTVNFTDRTLSVLIDNLKKLINEKNILLVNFTNEYPDVKKIDLQIKESKNSLKLVIRNNIKQLEQRKSDLQKLINKYNQRLNQIPVQETKLATLTRPLNINQSIYEFLLQKKAETSILKSSTISNSRIIDEARQAKEPIKPKRKLIIIVGLILGLIVGIAVSFFREFLISTVQNIDDVENLTDIPIYGTVPFKKDKLSNNIFNEALRSIRTNLQFLPSDTKNQVISITSSVSGEGKTTISAALSKILVNKEQKAIILDMDLRKSSVHKEFNIPNNIGMSNYLSGQNSLDEVVQHTSTEGLDIITTGTLPPNPSELISSKRFIELLDTLRDKYEYIIMDTPPAGLVTDAIILMNYSDISFFIVRNNYSKKDFVKNIDRISSEHSNNKVGIIVNGILLGKEYSYGSNYAYGYGNDKYYANR
jgi:capsular exopolysaccharide synthesis family protein